MRAPGEEEEGGRRRRHETDQEGLGVQGRDRADPLSSTAALPNEQSSSRPLRRPLQIQASCPIDPSSLTTAASSSEAGAANVCLSELGGPMQQQPQQIEESEREHNV